MDAILADLVSGELEIRAAGPGDVELIFSLIRELAAYERAPGAVTGDVSLLRTALFGPEPQAEALIAHVGDEPAGFALFYRTFSTWECRAGMWLEDLYVVPRHRRRGVGRGLLTRLAHVARERGATRLEWAALDWNELALNFYAAAGASRLPEWVLHRLDRTGIERAAGTGPGG